MLCSVPNICTYLLIINLLTYKKQKPSAPYGSLPKQWRLSFGGAALTAVGARAQVRRDEEAAAAGTVLRAVPQRGGAARRRAAARPAVSGMTPRPIATRILPIKPLCSRPRKSWRGEVSRDLLRSGVWDGNQNRLMVILISNFKKWALWEMSKFNFVVFLVSFQVAADN